MKPEPQKFEDDYQFKYNCLATLLEEIPLTYHQRKVMQEYLDDMEGIFREAND